MFASQTYPSEPTSMKAALSSLEAKHWKAAADEEFMSLQKNNTWTLQDLPPGHVPISCKWVFKQKLDQEGNVSRYKARLVARGFTQRYGEDYLETFAPVVKFSTMRIILALAAHEDLEMLQMDVFTAYLNGTITENIFMQQPDGYVKQGAEKKVCKLIKSLYGLKQSGRRWYERLDEYLIKCGFIRAAADTNLYVLNKDGSRLYLVVYVDDLLLVSKSLKLLNEVRDLLTAEFEMKILGDPAQLLGVQIKRNRGAGTITIDQTKYITDVLKRFGMNDSHGTSTPISSGIRLEKPQKSATAQEKAELDKLPYKQAVGSLISWLV